MVDFFKRNLSQTRASDIFFFEYSGQKLQSGKNRNRDCVPHCDGLTAMVWTGKE